MIDNDEDDGDGDDDDDRWRWNILEIRLTTSDYGETSDVILNRVIINLVPLCKNHFMFILVIC